MPHQISEEEFSAMMAAVGPFEADPHPAVAVSGGGDSMALCLLADAWARARGGKISALTVDHGLRPESAAEAATVGRWLGSRNIDHHILVRRGPKPLSGLQAAAREARYNLMCARAGEAGVLHLLVAHTMEDQAETFLLRLERGSGIDGLSAMAAVRETPLIRLVRPLLGVSRERLRDTLKAKGQDWIEDPANRDGRYARTHLRAAVKALAGKGLDPGRLAAIAHVMGGVRMTMESAVSSLLARCCAMHPEGYAYLDGAVLARAAPEASLRALARILVCIGAKTHPPRREKLESLHGLIAGGAFASARTLAGCRILPPSGKSGKIVICRERGRGAPTDADSGQIAFNPLHSISGVGFFLA